MASFPDPRSRASVSFGHVLGDSGRQQNDCRVGIVIPVICSALFQTFFVSDAINMNLFFVHWHAID